MTMQLETAQAYSNRIDFVEYSRRLFSEYGKNDLRAGFLLSGQASSRGRVFEFANTLVHLFAKVL